MNTAAHPSPCCGQAGPVSPTPSKAGPAASSRKRSEFPRAVRVAVIKRTTRDSVVYCEECGCPAKTFEIDHINADGLTGKPTIENARLLCTPCHRSKTKADVAAIAKAKRREARHLGASKPKGNIRGPSFAKPEPQRKASKPVEKFNSLPRRAMFKDVG